MLKRSIIAAMVVIMAISGMTLAAEKSEKESIESWKLAAQAFSFRKFTFFEAIDMTKEAGIKYIEMYPSQKLSAEKPDQKTHYSMSKEIQEEIKAKLKKTGVKLINYGVVNLPPNEQECRKVFDFAKAMGIETIVSEPKEDTLPMIDKLCSEYGIKVAIHNHPTPSRYWNPETVLKALEGRSDMIGACADTGHWTRSSVKPIEGIKMLEGKIVSLHLKDLNEFGVRKAHDLPWGTGVSGLKDVLRELRNQNFRGVFSIEYEHNWDNSLPEIKKCVEYFNEMREELFQK